MSQIYKSAIRVLVWLGPERDNSDLAMRCLAEAPTRWSNNSQFSYRERKSVIKLFWREYWHRVWIIQEFGLAAHLTLHCGNRSVDFGTIEHGLMVSVRWFFKPHRESVAESPEDNVIRCRIRLQKRQGERDLSP
jgi:hypothetical protein